jgi:hypothetical protein
LESSFRKEGTLFLILHLLILHYGAEGGNMYQIMPLDLMTPQEVTMYNTSVNATWSYDMNVFFQSHVSGKTIEAG